jgi:hypothetical protein
MSERPETTWVPGFEHDPLPIGNDLSRDSGAGFKIRHIDDTHTLTKDGFLIARDVLRPFIHQE